MGWFTKKDLAARIEALELEKEQWLKDMVEYRDFRRKHEAQIAAADALAAAHGNLWSALAEIIEAPGMAPNATVRRMAARAEKALVEDSIADIKPVPRFYNEAKKGGA